ncbi:MAG TPA: class I SAM-dependent methyltransferase [Herpetosiphonaceae bacterium]
MTDPHSAYGTAWDSFWRSLSGDPDEVLWDVEPRRAAALDLVRFADLADTRLPLVDLGCGNGTQTRFFARHFSQVWGVDVSAAALELACSKTTPMNVAYRVLDALDLEQAAALHAEIGDAHVYMRGVLQQIRSSDRPAVARTIEHLMGAVGIAYLIEYPLRAMDYYQAIAAQYGMPPGLARVRAHGITPGALAPEELDTLFPPERFEVLRQGETIMHTIHLLPNGLFARPPALYMVLRRRATALSA